MGLRGRAATACAAIALAATVTGCGGAVSRADSADGPWEQGPSGSGSSSGGLSGATTAVDAGAGVDVPLDAAGDGDAPPSEPTVDASLDSTLDATLDAQPETEPLLESGRPPEGSLDVSPDMGSEAGPDAAADSSASCGAYSPAASTSGACHGGVSFELYLGPGAWVAYGGPDLANSRTQALAITCPSGTLLPMQMSDMDSLIDCNTCTGSLSAALGAWDMLLGQDGGPSSVPGWWDGTYYASGTCGASASACMSYQCAPPGSYVALMCACPVASPGAACDGNVQCVQVPFDYPTSATVVGSLVHP